MSQRIGSSMCAPMRCRARNSKAKLTAINSMVDTVDAQRDAAGDAAIIPITLLRPGMFAKVEVVLPEKHKTLVIPGSAISYAPFGDSVFVIEKKKDREDRQGIADDPPTVCAGRAKRAAISLRSREGLKAGETVVSTGVFKLRNGMSVTINNDLAPKPEMNPNAGRIRRLRRSIDDEIVYRSFHPTPGAGDGGELRHSHRRLAGDEDDQRSPVSAQRHRLDHGDDGLRRRGRGTGPRIHHHAARARHRRGGRHRLHPIAEPAERLDDHGASETELRREQGALRYQLESRCDPRDLPPESRDSGHRHSVGRFAVRFRLPQFHLQHSSA